MTNRRKLKQLLELSFSHDRLDTRHRRQNVCSETLEQRMLLAADLGLPLPTPAPDSEFAFYGPIKPGNWLFAESSEAPTVGHENHEDLHSEEAIVLAEYDDWGASFQEFQLNDIDHSSEVPAAFHIDESGFGRLDDGGDSSESNSEVPPNISMTGVFVRDADGSLVSSIPIGQRVAIQAHFSTEGIPAGSVFDIEFIVDGIPLVFADSSFAVGNGNWFAWWSGWYAGPGVNNFSVDLDSNNDVFETDEGDNFAASSFTPFAPTDLPQQLIFPTAGVRNEDFAINNYADVDPRSNTREDFAGGIFQYDGHNAWDLGPMNFLSQDQGFPIVAAADGVVVNADDGHFDRKTSFANTPANFVIIDHGNNWNTIYWHLARDSVAVEIGQTVKAGDVIGEMGSSGISTGTHLHFTLRRFNYPVETMFDTNTYFHPLADVAYQPTTDIAVTYSNINNNSSPSNSDWREGFPTRRVYSTSDTSERVVFNFGLSHMNVGDTYNVHFTRPDGTRWTGNVTATSQLRFPQWYWWIGGNIWGTQTGNWRVDVELNGTTIHSEPFQVISGTQAPAQIRVFDSLGNNVNPGRTTPFDFGSVPGTTQTFTVQNHGDSPLNLTDLRVPPGFSFSGSPPSAINPGQQASFTVRMDSTLNGQAFGSVEFDTNDPDLPRFWFNVEGNFTGTPPSNISQLDFNGPAVGYQLGLGPQQVDGNVDFTYGATANSVLNAGFIFEGGDRPGDRLLVTNRGNISVSGTTVSHSGTPIGTITQDGVAPNNLVVTSLPTAPPITDSIVEDLFAAIDFDTSSIEPGPRFIRGLTEDTSFNSSTHAYKSIRVFEPLAPQVKELILSSTAWTPSFIDTVDGGGPGAGNGLGYAVTPNSPPLPWNDVDRIYVQFSEEMVGVTDASFELRDSNGVIPVSASYDPVTNIATLLPAIPGPFVFSKLRLGVSDLITDTVGMRLDGDTNGSTGGIFDLRFDVVPGDANGDGRVNGSDFGPFTAAFLSQSGQPNYNPFVDWNADDRVNGSDFAVFTPNFLSNINTLSEPGAAFSGGGGGGEGEDSSSGASYGKGHDNYFLGLGSGQDEDDDDWSLDLDDRSLS